MKVLHRKTLLDNTFLECKFFGETFYLYVNGSASAWKFSGVEVLRYGSFPAQKFSETGGFRDRKFAGTGALLRESSRCFGSGCGVPVFQKFTSGELSGKGRRFCRQRF